MVARPGSIDHALALTEYPDGYVPPTKVMLQELLPSGKAGRVMRELKFWSQISTSRQVGAKGRAIISLSNTDDRFFRHRARRIFNPQKEPAYKAYLTDLHRRVLPYVKEISPERRKGNLLEFQGVRAFDETTLADYVTFLHNFDGYAGGMALQTPKGAEIDLPALGLLQRVTVDQQGPDGIWYAVFTGIVSGIDDTYRAGEPPTINLICSDYWRLFDLSEIIIRTGADPIADNIQREFSTAAAESLAYQATALDNLTGPKIISIVMDTTQRTMCWIPYALWKRGVPLRSTGLSSASSGMPDGRVAPLPESPTESFQVGTLRPRVCSQYCENLGNLALLNWYRRVYGNTQRYA